MILENLNSEKATKVQVLIIGEMACCVCGGMMSQKDVDNQQAILSTHSSQIPFIGIIAHINHFWDVEKQQYPADYELNMSKFAFAVGKDQGAFTPETEAVALAEIEKLERKFKR